MRFLAVLLALTLPAFAQIRYSPTGFTAPFISTVTNQASAQAYLGISGGGGGSVTNFGGSATNLQVYSSGTTNRPFRVFGTNGTSEVYVDKDATINTPSGTSSALAINFNGVGLYNASGNLRSSAQMMYPAGSWIQAADATEGLGSFGTTAGVGLRSAGNITWGSSTLWYSSQDTAISRHAAGVLEINTSTAGQLRDLLARSLYATNLYATNITAQGYLTTQQTLAYASGTNVTVDASKSLHFVTLTNTSYFAQPSSLAVGSSFTVILKQDSTGGRAVTFNTNYWKFPGGVQPSITTNANAYSVLSCIADPYGTNVFSVSTLDIK